MAPETRLLVDSMDRFAGAHKGNTPKAEGASMDVCEDCKRKISDAYPDPDLPFPAYEIAGGFLGTTVAVATGAVLLVPAAFVAGAVMDLLKRRCRMSDAEIEDEDSGCHVMTAPDDGQGGRFFRSAGEEENISCSPRRPGARLTRQPPREYRQAERREGSAFRELPGSLDDEREAAFVFGEIAGKLVRRDVAPAENPDFSMETGSNLTQHGMSDFGGSASSPFSKALSDGLPDLGDDGISVTEEYNQFGERLMEVPLL